MVQVNQYSGLAGIAAWINTYYRLKDEDKMDKKDKRVEKIKKLDRQSVQYGKD